MSEARREEATIQMRARVATAEAERLAAEHRLTAALAHNDTRESALRSAKHDEEQMGLQLEAARRQVRVQARHGT